MRENPELVLKRAFLAYLVRAWQPETWQDSTFLSLPGNRSIFYTSWGDFLAKLHRKPWRKRQKSTGEEKKKRKKHPVETAPRNSRIPTEWGGKERERERDFAAHHVLNTFRDTDRRCSWQLMCQGPSQEPIFGRLERYSVPLQKLPSPTPPNRPETDPKRSRNGPKWTQTEPKRTQMDPKLTEIRLSGVGLPGGLWGWGGVGVVREKEYH